MVVEQLSILHVHQDGAEEVLAFVLMFLKRWSDSLPVSLNLPSTDVH